MRKLLPLLIVLPVLALAQTSTVTVNTTTKKTQPPVGVLSLDGASNFVITRGTGTPEGTLAANPGSLYLDLNGALWEKASGIGNTGWTQLGAAPANPTGTVGLSAVNGTLPTFMRSDAAPPLSQAIVPVWTGQHDFEVPLLLAEVSPTPTAPPTGYGVMWFDKLNQNLFFRGHDSGTTNHGIKSNGFVADKLLADINDDGTTDATQLLPGFGILLSTGSHTITISAATPTATPTATPSATWTPFPTPTVTPTATVTPTPTYPLNYTDLRDGWHTYVASAYLMTNAAGNAVVLVTPTATATATATFTPTSTPTASATWTPIFTPTVTPTPTATPTATPTPIIAGLGFTADGNGGNVVAGQQGYIVVRYPGTITGWSIAATGTNPTCTIDVWKIGSGTALPTVANTIMGTKPQLSTGNVKISTTLTSWTTSFSADDIFGFNIDSVSNATRITFQLKTSQ